MLPYLHWSVSHPQDSEDPTASPVPSSVNGTVQLLVYNNASYAITVRRAVLLILFRALPSAYCSHAMPADDRALRAGLEQACQETPLNIHHLPRFQGVIHASP